MSLAYRFGLFELDTRTGDLRKGGTRIRLQEQPLRILRLLLERSGEVVLREEIRSALWPNGTVVEFGHGINAAVQRLRDALAESASSPRYIETVARRGYRFIGEVEIVEDRSEPESAVAAPDDLDSETLSHYRVIEKIGAGAMGVVYRAEDLRLGRFVALKVLADGFSKDPLARKRFAQESRAASALNHPHVCTIYDVGEHAGQPVISMELLDGETVSALIDRGPIPANRTIQLARQLAHALAAAHRKGIIHGDLKPANLMVTEQGLKVLDFGLAQVGKEYCAALGVAGTPNYMSPEQRRGMPLSSRSDVFSFGLVLFEMLHGPRAFESGRPLGVRGCPRRLKRIIRRCLETDPSARWRDAEELKGELERSVARDFWRDHKWAAAAAVVSMLIGIPVGRVLTGQTDSGAAAEIRNASRAMGAIKPQPPGEMKATRLSLSPDGRNIAYTSHGRVFVQGLDSGKSIPLPGTDGAGTPFWSAEGTSIAFVASGALKAMRINGSQPVTLGDINTNIGGTWVGDDILIGAIGDGVFRARASGGAISRLTRVDFAMGEVRHLAPQFLPDRRTFLFVAASTASGGSMLYAGSLDSPERRSILRVNSNVAYVTASRDGFLIYLKENTLVAHRFDPRALHVVGDPMPIISPLSSLRAVGTPLQLVDFSAVGDTIAFRSDAMPMQDLFRFEPAVDLRRVTNQITVIRNWMKQFGG